MITHKQTFKAIARVVHLRVLDFMSMLSYSLLHSKELSILLNLLERVKEINIIVYKCCPVDVDAGVLVKVTPVLGGLQLYLWREEDRYTAKGEALVHGLTDWGIATRF
eukprot:scaffold1_cov375-Pavlova_lutheri.AAC.15